MQLRQNPFSVYDFLGYFTPGVLLIVGGIALLPTVGIELQIPSALRGVEGYVFLTLAAYTAGHLLSFLSSITIEKYAVDMLGYPSEYLLGASEKGYFKGNGWNFFKNETREFLVRTWIFVAILPVTLTDLFFRVLLGPRVRYTRKLDEFQLKVVEQNIAKVVSSAYDGDKEASREGSFMIAYHHCVENRPNHFPKLQNYVALYGFARTISLIVVLGTWILAYDFAANPNTQGLVTVASGSLVSYFFYRAFVKFYTRFSKEVFMAVSTGTSSA